MEMALQQKIAAAGASLPQYPAEAFEFIAESVPYAVSALSKKRHVSAAELCAKITEYAGEKFGPVAGMVLRSWGLVSSNDAGRIVYALIGSGVLAAGEDDSPDDFQTGRSLLPDEPGKAALMPEYPVCPQIDM